MSAAVEVTFEQIGAIALRKDIDIYQLQGQLEAATEQLMQARKDVSTHLAAVEALRQQKGGLEDQVDALTGRVAELEEQLAETSAAEEEGSDDGPVD